MRSGRDAHAPYANYPPSRSQGLVRWTRKVTVPCSGTTRSSSTTVASPSLSTPVSPHNKSPSIRTTCSPCAAAFAEVILACAGENQQPRCPRRRNRTQDAREDAGRCTPRPLGKSPRTTCLSWLSSARTKDRAQGDSARTRTRTHSTGSPGRALHRGSHARARKRDAVVPGD